MTASTLVETVSINYEDFTEGFLTCSTCLCTYDAGEHYPKLLHCSHTVCKSCLEKIASLPGVGEAGSFRCPICRETIPLPRGGIITLPPSFLVNQLLDLMARQRREVIPKCSTHVNQELLFCETCDVVFCNVCTSGCHSNVSKKNPANINDQSNRATTANNHLYNNNNNSNGNSNTEHTVITFSIAIKRMSEILVYRGTQCISKLDDAHENIQREIRKLDQNADLAYEDINRTFQEMINIFDQRRQELLGLTKKIREDKRSVLEDQLKAIQVEKSKVESEINSLQYQVEVNNITRKINELGDKLDALNCMAEPQENCFIRYEHLHNSAVNEITRLINDFGAIRTSKTFPSLCTASISKCCAFLRSIAKVTALDYRGDRQRTGGDPVSADLVHCNDSSVAVSVRITDNKDGTYDVLFIPPKCGTYSLKITIFGRPIRSYPLVFDVTDQINPLYIYGCRGPDTHQFNQPVALTVDPNGTVCVLDTGNNRVSVLMPSDTINSPFNCINQITDNNQGYLSNKSALGIALNTGSLSPGTSVFVSNWRTKYINELEIKSGNFLRNFTHSDLVQPTHLAVNSIGEILVADNEAKCIFIFHQSGSLIRKIDSASSRSGTCVSANCATSTATCVASSSPANDTHHNTKVKIIGENKIQSEKSIKSSSKVKQSSIKTINSTASNSGSVSPSTCISKNSAPSSSSSSSSGCNVICASFGVIGALAIGPNDEIIVADSIIHILSSNGLPLRYVFPEGRGRGSYGGVACDFKGHLVATRVEKTKSFIQVFDYSSGQLKFVINSSEAKLKRPSSIATTSEYHAIVVDLGNDCIKKYRYH